MSRLAGNLPNAWKHLAWWGPKKRSGASVERYSTPQKLDLAVMSENRIGTVVTKDASKVLSMRINPQLMERMRAATLGPYRLSLTEIVERGI